MEKKRWKIRKEFQTILNKIRINKGIKITAIKLVDDKGKEITDSHKSLMFNNKRNMPLSTAMQVIGALGVRLSIDSSGIHIYDEEFAKHIYVSMPTDVFLKKFEHIETTADDNIPVTYVKMKKSVPETTGKKKGKI